MENALKTMLFVCDIYEYKYIKNLFEDALDEIEGVGDNTYHII